MYQAWNVFDVGNLLQWLEENQTRRIDFVPIFLEHPEQLHSAVWPKHVQDKIVEYFKSISTDRHQDALDRIINYALNTDKYSAEQMKRMKQFIEINDRHRKYRFADIFPYLNQILEEECRI